MTLAKRRHCGRLVVGVMLGDWFDERFRAAGARSSLTVPILDHGTVIGTLNVENTQPNAFDARDVQYLEIYARSVAGALKMLELLQAY